MPNSFFDGPTGPTTTVDMKTAAVARPATLPPATVNEAFFGEKRTAERKAAAPATTSATDQVQAQLVDTVAAMNKNIEQQNVAMQNLAQASDPRAQMAAMAQFEQMKQQQQNYIQQYKPPDAGDLDDLVTDGEAIKNFVERTSNWALQSARAEMAPLVEQMRAVTELSAPVLQDARNRAWENAAGQLRSRGFQEEHLPQMRQLTEAIAQRSYQDPTEQQKFLLNADGMRYAAEAAYEQLGNKMPARGEAPPVGAPESRGGRRPESAGASPMMQSIGERLGIDISPETHQKFADFKRANG